MLLLTVELKRLHWHTINARGRIIQRIPALSLSFSFSDHKTNCTLQMHLFPVCWIRVFYHPLIRKNHFDCCEIGWQLETEMKNKSSSNNNNDKKPSSRKRNCGSDTEKWRKKKMNENTHEINAVAIHSHGYVNTHTLHVSKKEFVSNAIEGIAAAKIRMLLQQPSQISSSCDVEALHSFVLLASFHIYGRQTTKKYKKINRNREKVSVLKTESPEIQ